MRQIQYHSMACCPASATANGLQIFCTGLTGEFRMVVMTYFSDLLLRKSHWVNGYSIILRQSNWSCQVNHWSSMTEITLWSWCWRDYQHGTLLTDGVSAIGRRDASGSSLARRSLPVVTIPLLILKLAHFHRYGTPWVEWRKFGRMLSFSFYPMLVMVHRASSWYWLLS